MNLSPAAVQALFAAYRAEAAGENVSDDAPEDKVEDFFTPDELRVADAFSTYYHLAAIAKVAQLYVDREALEKQVSRKTGLSTQEVRAAVSAFTAAVPLNEWVDVASESPLIVKMGEGVGERERTVLADLGAGGR